MPLRRDVIDRLNREVAGYEEKIAEAAESARLSGVAEAQAEAEKDEAAELEARGALSSQAARKRFEDAAAKARRHAGEAERLTLLGQKLELGLAERRRELAFAEFEQALGAVQRAAAASSKVASRLGAALVDVVGIAAELARKRDARERAIAEALAIRPEGADFDCPAEQAWLPEPGELKALLELLEAEDKRRRAERARARGLEEARRNAGKPDARKQIAAFNRTGDEALLEPLNEADVTEARRQHGVLRRRWERDVMEFVEQVERGKLGPGDALGRLRQLPTIEGPPEDLLAEARQRIEAAVGVAA